MEIRITTSQILKVLQIISWIIFIGLCIESGALIVNTIITIFINPNRVLNYWDGAEYLTRLINYDYGYFCVITLIMIIVSLFKAIMFYFILELFTDNHLNFTSPFNTKLKQCLSNLSLLAFGIGIFIFMGKEYTNWLNTKNFQLADFHSLNFVGANVWLFMSVILFIIIHIVKRGIELQSENEMTV